MDLNEFVAAGCIAAGLLMIGVALVMHLTRDRVEQKIEKGVEDLNKVAIEAAGRAATADAPGPGEALGTTAAPQALALSGAAEYVKALGELAGNLSKLTPPISALLISTILFFFAAVIATADTIDDGDDSQQESSQEVEAAADNQGGS